jgi:hypothetical protein
MLDGAKDENDRHQNGQRRPARQPDGQWKQQVADEFHGNGPGHRIPHEPVIEEGLEQRDEGRKPAQLLRIAMHAEAEISIHPKQNHAGGHGKMHRIDPKGAPRQEGANVAPFQPAIHGGQDESTEDKEDVDAGVPVMGQAGPEAIADIGHAQLKMERGDPQRRKSPYRGKGDVFLPHRTLNLGPCGRRRLLLGASCHPRQSGRLNAGTLRLRQPSQEARHRCHDAPSTSGPWAGRRSAWAGTGHRDQRNCRSSDCAGPAY